MQPSQPPKPKVEAAPATEGTGADQPEGQPTLPSPAERMKEARTRRRRAIRQFLVIALCLVALLCLGGVGAGFLLYNQATKPDLGTPEHVTRKYLEAYLIDRDEYTAKKYQCSNSSGLAEIRALRADIDDRQKRYGVTFTYSVDGARELDRAGNDARVSVDLVLSTTSQDQPLREVEHWEIATHNEGGWRVCGAHEVS